MKKLMMLSVGLVLAGWTAQAAIIAEWNFVPGANFLADSVGGHTLVQGSGNAVTPDVGPGGSGNSAYFDGTGALATASTLDLTSYRHIRISWSMKDQGTGAWSVVYDHGWDAEGGLLTDLGAGTGGASIRAGDAGYLAMTYPHAYGTTNTVWADFAVEINLDDATFADQLQVFKNGVNAGTLVSSSGVPAGSFLNANFALGALTEGGANFVGNIANVTIESVPEPGTILLLVTGGLFCCAQRKRK